jgi:AcrR family transcriptional regulator
MKQDDRRVQRTRDLLRRALMELIREKDYDSVTVQDIVDRANVGRATFYLHFQSKDDLFLRSHLIDMDYPYDGILTKDELLGAEPTRSLVEIFRYVRDNRSMFMVIANSKDATIIMKHIRAVQVDHLETSLRNAFPETQPTVDLHTLANYLAGARFSLMTWWVETRSPQSPEEIAKLCHLMQRAAICEAFGLHL